MRRLLLAPVLVVALAGCGSAAHGVPKGFQPETAVAFGPSDIWILGRGAALVRSTDGGAHFEQVASPPLRAVGNGPSLLFANASDGFAYVVYGGGLLYATHDGGHSWSASLSGVLYVAVGGGYVFAITLGHGLERSPLGRDTWTELSGAQAKGTTVAADGSRVWLLGPPRQRPDADTIQKSVDAGRTLTSSRGPCFFELPGRLVPAGGNVLWAVCPTGMMASLLRSTDGGRSFPLTRSFHDPDGTTLPPLTNGAQIFPFSRDAAVVYGGGGGPIFRTTDGGRHWVRTRQPWTLTGAPVWLGFPTRSVGYALASSRLWRTTDGGASWHTVPIH